MTSIPLSSITDDKRRTRDHGDLSGLKDSLSRVGSIHPIVLSKTTSDLNGNPNNETFSIVAGGRRFAAMKALGVKELFHGSILNPSKLGFLFRDEVPEHELREAELDENLYRLKPRWQEDCLLVLDIHKLKRKVLGANKWGQRQTAELLGPGYSKSNVNLAIKVAELLVKGDKEIASCENLMEANAVRLKRCEDNALAEMQRRTLPKGEVQVSSTPSDTSSFLDAFTLKTHNTPGFTPTSASLPSLAPSIQTGPLQTKEPVHVPLSHMFRLGDFREAFRPASAAEAREPFLVNHIVTDIPYGIDMSNLNASSKLDDVLAEHEVEANIDLMKPFLEFAWSTLKPQGFCVFFYDLDHHEKLQTWAKDIGWTVQRWPLVWHKLHSCQNNAAQYNSTKDYECAMILRKDSHTVRRLNGGSSVFSCDGSAERKLYQNPFAKPFELWKWIFDMIAFPGQTVLDPFCGEMSSCRAAANCGLIPYGIEINPKHFNRGIETMKSVFGVIHKNNVIFT